MAKSKSAEIKTPPSHDWRTTDTDEINKRRLRAHEGAFVIANLDARHPIFSNFRVQSGGGFNYSVEIRDPQQRQFACDCVDFRTNGLGTCKHVEAVLLHLEARLLHRLGQARRVLVVTPASLKTEWERACSAKAAWRKKREWPCSTGRWRSGAPWQLKPACPSRPPWTILSSRRCRTRGGDALPLLRDFAADVAQAWRPLVEKLETI